jgi:hypothetical protein
VADEMNLVGRLPLSHEVLNPALFGDEVCGHRKTLHAISSRGVVG